MIQSDSRRRLGGVVALLGLALLGGVATALSMQRAIDTERRADERAAAAVADRLSTRLSASLASLNGSDAMATDGEVSQDEFTAYTNDVLDRSAFTALAYAEEVDGRERAEWEARTGIRIMDTDGNGGFTPSPARDRYVVVRYVAPANDTSRRVVGFDFLSDAVRGSGVELAAASTQPVLVGPIRLATSASPGMFTVNAVHGPNGRVLGFIGSGLSVSTSLDQRLAGIPHLGPVTVEVDGMRLIGDGGGDAVAQFDFASQRFTVRTSDTSTVAWMQPLAIAFGTVAMLFAARVAGRRARDDARRQEREARRNSRMAELAEELVAATTTDAVVRLVTQHAGDVLGAAHTNVGRRSTTDPSKLEVFHDPDMDEALASKYSIQSVDDHRPLTDSVRENRVVLVRNRQEHLVAYPDVMDDVERAGVRAVLCVPLGLGSDAANGTIGFAWTTDLSRRDADDLTAAARLVAQMAGRAYERAAVRELVQQRVSLLSDFAARLAAAHTSTDIAAAVEQVLPPLLDLRVARLAPSAPEPSPDERTYRVDPTSSEHLVLEPRPGVPWTATLESLATAVTELLGGATARARLSEHEHTVLQRLQQSLLTAPPEVDGIDIAVAYRSAIEAVGIGGDWYSVVDTPAAVYAVIGDIAGHGPGAVALMAQVKTVIRHLLSLGAPMEEALQHASAHLESREAYASAVIVRIDKASPTIGFVNAGHPYPIVRRGTQADALTTIHRPWLGVHADISPPTEVEFPPGSLLLLYTDGLVEERRTTMVASMDSLAAHIATDTHVPDALVQHLLERRSNGRTPTSVDDDIAIVAVARRP